MPLINRYQTPINPVNYAVWYEYVSGNNQALVNAIDTRLSKDEDITPELTQYLYEKYVLLGMPERLEQTNNGLRLVVDNTINNINRAEMAAGDFASDLNQSQSLLEHCDDLHIAARFGGDEMAMLLLHSNAHEAHTIGEAIRSSFAESRLKKKGSQESIGEVTVSIGVGMFRAGDSPVNVVERSDQALYKAKVAGRNRVIVNNSEPVKTAV